ncbi:DNA phosphorothioation-dependent restriction protein DptG, partial [Oleiphilus sp. HI0123]
MSILKKDLTVTNINSLNGYFPVRTSNSEDSFDWEIAKGIVVRNMYRKIVSPALTKPIEGEDGSKQDQSFAQFREICRDDFLKRIDEEDLWPYLEKMYFANDAFFDVAPESLLFKITSLKASNPKNRLGDLYSSLMGGFYLKNPIRIQRNFLEQQVVDSLRDPKVLEDFTDRRVSKGVYEKPYLPFLTHLFRTDLKFLADRPKYLLEKLEDLLKLYGYLYTAQLALNIKGWRSLSEPDSKPLYFIMENETASKERTDLVKNGHQRVSILLENLFPYLTMSEGLQDPNIDANEHRLPLWEFASKLSEEDSPAL